MWEKILNLPISTSTNVHMSVFEDRKSVESTEETKKSREVH